ncbi:MAG TPA: PilZ domain-containing protein [bacterium]
MAQRVVRDLPVRYRLTDAADWHVTLVRDFSRDGARLVSKQVFVPGTLLVLQLGPPLLPSALEVSAKVVWHKVKETGAGQEVEHGLSFSPSETLTRRRIHEAIQRLLKPPPMGQMVGGEWKDKRRAAPRIVRNFTIRYRSPGDAAWRVTTLRDFSRDGARLVCDEEYAPGSAIDLQLGMPIFVSPVQLTARVVWQHPVFGHKLQMTEHGVSFSGMNATLRSAIGEAVDRYLHHPPPAK